MIGPAYRGLIATPGLLMGELQMSDAQLHRSIGCRGRQHNPPRPAALGAHAATVGLANRAG